MKIRTAGVQDLETVSRIHALSWKTAYRGILPDDFLDQLSYRRWVAPLKDMMEQGLEIRVIEEEEKPFGCITFSAARDQAFAGSVRNGAMSAQKAVRSPAVSGQSVTGVCSSRLHRLSSDFASSRAVPRMSQTWNG